MTRKFALLAALLISGAVACADADTTGAKSGQLNIQLTDAPFPFDEVQSVDVFVVRIDAKEADADSAAAADESSGGGWRTLVSPGASFDLLTLRGGKTANLGVATLPNGTYRGFRMVIDTDKSSITLKDGTKPEVKWPSAGTSGIKIKLDEPVAIGAVAANLLIDFDVGESFVMRGNSISKNGLLFKPVIRAVSL